MDNSLIVSQHALYRYMERVLKFDFTDLRLLYSVEMGYPSMNHIKEAHFLGWCESHVGLGIFRHTAREHVWSLMSQRQRNIAMLNKNMKEHVLDRNNNLVFVVQEDTIVTVIWNGTKKHEVESETRHGQDRAYC